MKTVVEMENSGVIHMLKHNKIEGMIVVHKLTSWFSIILSRILLSPYSDQRWCSPVKLWAATGSAVWRIWLVILLVLQLIKLLILPTQFPCFSHNSLGEVRLTFVFLSYSVCMIFQLASCNNTSYFHLANPAWDSGKHLCFNMWDKPFLVFCSQTWHECIDCSAVWRRDWRPCVTVWRAILGSKAKLLLLMRSLKHEIIQYHTSRFESHHPPIHKVVMYCIQYVMKIPYIYIVNVIFSRFESHHPSICSTHP